MNIEEHKVVRNVVKDEVLRAIDDFRSGTPKITDCLWGRRRF